MKYTNIKNTLRKDIGMLRNEVLSLMEANKKVPDIEKLERQEFDMDLEEKQKMVAEKLEKLKGVRFRI